MSGNPQHRIVIKPASCEVRVVFAGETIAQTQQPLLLYEGDLPTRYYIPAEDVFREYLLPSPTKTICPYKGEASYWSVLAGDRRADDAAWAYMAPLPQCAAIKGYFCFYPEKVEVEVEGGPERR